MANRMSTYSINSFAHRRTSTLQNTSQQVSTTTLLNALHNSFTSSQPYSVETSTSLVVNTWLSATQTGPDGRVGGTVDTELARRAWEHARRRAEDAAIVLGSLHHSTPSLLAPFISALPLSVPGSLYTALDVLRPFLHAAAPHNPSEPLYSGLSATFGLNMAGELISSSLNLSTSGIDTKRGLLEVPTQKGHRAFDVFYLLLAGPSSPQEREYLGLKRPEQYSLLRKSETYEPPSYLPTADDSAAAEDFRTGLKTLGIKGKHFRSLLCVLTAVLRLGDALGFLVDQEELESTCEEVEGLLELEADVLLKKCVTEEREVLIAAIYEALVDWVIQKANEAIKSEMHNGRVLGSSSGSETGMATPPSGTEDQEASSITVIHVPQQGLGRALGLKTVFDDSTGINLEMREDGIVSNAAGSSVMRDMKDAVAANEPGLNITTGALGRDREAELDRRENVLEKIGAEATVGSFIHNILYPISGQGIVLGKSGRFHLTNLLASSRVWFHLCLHPSDELPATHTAGPMNWSAGCVSSEIRAWRLPEWANHRNRALDYTTDFDIAEFANRYSRLGCTEGREGVETWIMERGWSNGEVFVGTERVWMREAQWWEAESMLDMLPAITEQPHNGMRPSMIGADAGYASTTHLENPFYTASQYGESKEHLMSRGIKAQSMAPSAMQSVRPGDYGLGHRGDDKRNWVTYDGEVDPELAENKHVEVVTTSIGRRVWVAFTWMCTFWIPSFMLSFVGRMKRPDVRMAWREKVTLMFLIVLMNATVVFWIVGFGNLICPNWDKAWNSQEVNTHQNLADNDFWVSFHGKVYDISKFAKTDHSGVAGAPTTSDTMEPFGGLDMNNYIIPPLSVACPALVSDDSIKVRPNVSVEYGYGIHYYGNDNIYPTSGLADINWYGGTFLPKMAEYYKGQLVWDPSDVYRQGNTDQRYWFILNGKIYDLSNYFATLKLMNGYPGYAYISSAITTFVQANAGLDVSSQWSTISNATDRANTLQCLNNAFYLGDTDFRKTARCQFNNYLLLAFTCILCAVIAVKFLAALQLGSKRRPAQQDKFVICQVPAYTEGEDSLRKGLDSLTALAYDNKRKLICVICDGMIVGGGNDRPTPKIVLDILGVDPKIDPPALPFKSVGVGSEQLNYGKVYSGLYEYEGNVVPYIVVVKVGKESEQSKAKPGNRGKRDSQILLMSFLNRVHHRSPMNPLELEMFHQINNVIGVDPELYEYLFMVDADTKVKEDSLNRLVAACAHDTKIAGICGETSLENEERSWWTMIQVYEYYISHHLAKAFESLFGSVTCLPGCFCMYRLRSGDKGRPLIIADKVIQEYSVNNLDTLHKKNLLALGEDRYLTTLMTKHFPMMSYKFVPDAYALTEAPSEWGVLLSQRRRWINSTIHNLAELMFIKDLCGFCCFSMRFVVFIDLFGTIILPATCAYLVYLIYRVASHSGQFPLISLIMLAVVYGLQAIIFIVKRQWQHVGWMIIYLLAYPIYSFVLPVYSFWKQDDFSWGNTRIVIGEKGNKQLVAVDNEGFDPRTIPLQRWDDYATAHGLAGRRGLAPEKEGSNLYQDGDYEMDDIRSTYSAKPASTVLTGFPLAQSYRSPQSPSPYNALQSPGLQRYTDSPQAMDHRHMSMGSEAFMTPLPYGSRVQSQDNLLAMQSPSPLAAHRSRSTFGAGSRPVSTNNLATMAAFTTQGPTNEVITQAIRECLSEVDLDSVTKKQLKALAEQKLQCQLQGEKRAFLDSQIDLELANM